MFNMEEYFNNYPEGFFGQYGNTELKESKVFSLMNTFENNTLIRYLKLLDQYKNKSIDLKNALTLFKTNEEFQNFLNTQSNYFGVFKIVSSVFREYLIENRKDEFINDKF
jgi:hypothetical protein